jgi:ESF2/ABP1 family protein
MKEKARSKDKIARNFTEGWIEFVSKRVAKNVAENLNTTQVGGKKRSKAHDVLWNIKYLPRQVSFNISVNGAAESRLPAKRISYIHC